MEYRSTNHYNYGKTCTNLILNAILDRFSYTTLKHCSPLIKSINWQLWTLSPGKNIILPTQGYFDPKGQ